MNRTIPRRESTDHQRPSPIRCVTFARWALAVGLLASLLFAHGCHGDADHELFTQMSAWADPIQPTVSANQIP